MLFLREKPLLFVVPPEDTRSDEITYLMRLFPYGERIYRAAFAGNREAQLVLAKCYDNGSDYSTLFTDERREESNLCRMLCGLPPDTNAFHMTRGAYWRHRAADAETEE